MPERTTAVSRRPARAAAGRRRRRWRRPGSSAWTRDVGALARQRRGELLDAVPAAAAAAPLAGADDDDVPRLVEAQELRERQVEPGGDPLGDRERRAASPRARPARASARRRPLRSARSRSERPIASRSARTRVPTAESFSAAIVRSRSVRYHVRLYGSQRESACVGPDQDLVDRDVLGLRDRVDDRVGDVLRASSTLPICVAHLLDLLDAPSGSRCAPGARCRRSPARRR